MPYSIIPSRKFEKEAKRLIRKYASLKQELAELGEMLSREPDMGMPLGGDLFKIRLAVKS